MRVFMLLISLSLSLPAFSVEDDKINQIMQGIVMLDKNIKVLNSNMKKLEKRIARLENKNTAKTYTNPSASSSKAINKSNDNFSKLDLGMSKNKVLSLVGKPINKKITGMEGKYTSEMEYWIYGGGKKLSFKNGKLVTY